MSSTDTESAKRIAARHRVAISAPTSEQMEALKDYADWAGSDWKKKLYRDWMRGGSTWRGPWSLLQQVRDQFGPAWLDKFELR